MKELTIEEKAKLYDDAKARMSIAYNSNRCTIGFMNEIFPEPKESDDEKIRKEIIGFIKNWKNPNNISRPHDFPTLTRNEEQCNKYIAWLEKQGEHNSIEEPNFFDDFRNSDVEVDSNEDGLVAETIKYKDEKMIDTIISDLERHGGKEDSCYSSEINYLKSLKGRVQPKQDWSQNDIDMIGWLIRCCEKEHEELCNDKYGHQDIVSDLKRDCRKKWDWLESLKNRVAPQKQWKPSEEYILVVESCMKEFDEGSIKWNLLKKLLEQLKQL